LTHTCNSVDGSAPLVLRAQKHHQPCLPKPDGESLECLDYKSLEESPTMYERAGAVGVNTGAGWRSLDKSMEI
jgi:hypothetical protein